jgi:catechol 2,3-dioxygenase-like lactoylglutathione lyase family enzyme
MTHKGFSHIGLATNQLDKTVDFYTNVLGFRVARFDVIEIEEGGQLRHAMIDVGRDQLIAFMEPVGIAAISDTWDTGIVTGLGVPPAFYHFSFEAGTEGALERKHAELAAKGVDVTPMITHADWAKSFYFTDPNGLNLEYMSYTRDLTEEDAIETVRERATVTALVPPTD